MSEHVFIPMKSRAERYRFWGGVLGILALVVAGWLIMMKGVIAEAFVSVESNVIDTKSYIERLDDTTPVPASVQN